VKKSIPEKEKKEMREKLKNFKTKGFLMLTALSMFLFGGNAVPVLAGTTDPTPAPGGGTSVTVNENATMDSVMGNVIGFLLTMTRWVGVALLIYGVYEIVMSFMQNQPEAKTKGIIMAFAGVVLIALKSALSLMGVSVS
jgi:hypothetical protein